MPSSSDYYDIDSILAEEELVPCSCLFDFSHLGHLNKDEQDEKYLKEGTKLKMPLWALHKWASLQYVNLSVPRSWNKKTRETLIADPRGVDLRKRNPHYFLAGAHVANLLSNDNPESSVVRQFLLQTYMGARLRQTLDWSWSSAHDDDVSGYVVHLTQLETRLFRAGASASAAHAHWILHGSSSGQQQQKKNKNNNRRRAVTPDAEEQEDEKRQRVQ